VELAPKAPSPGLPRQSDLSPQGEVKKGKATPHPYLSPGGKGRREAAGEGALQG